MNKLTTINTIKKAAPLALLAVVMSGSAFAGPKGERPTGPKLSIDVYNECTASGTSLSITTTVTPSDSKKSDGNATINNPIADPAFKGDECRTNPKNGKQICKSAFVPSGQTTTLYMSSSDPLTYTTMAAIDLCAIKSSLTTGDVVNAEVSVAVDYDTDNEPGVDVTTTWVSQCDDDPSTNCYDESTGEYYVCEKYDESIVKVDASCL